MTKVREILQDALIEVGVLSPTGSMEAEDAQFALRTLNRMIQQWNNQELMVYTMDRQTFNLVAGQQSYTMGPGGNFNVPRPVKIEMASVLINTASPQPLEIPLDILTDAQWRDVVLKQTPSLFPLKMWATGNVPLNTLWFWPVPQDSSVDLILYTWGQTSNFANLNTDVVFPPGYEEALVTNLAVWLCSSYGREVPNSLGTRASMSKSVLESINIEPLDIQVDGCLLGNRGFSLAIRSNGYVVDN